MFIDLTEVKQAVVEWLMCDVTQFVLSSDSRRHHLTLSLVWGIAWFPEIISSIGSNGGEGYISFETVGEGSELTFLFLFCFCQQSINLRANVHFVRPISLVLYGMF